MYNTILSKVNKEEIYGMDTDSAFLSYNAYQSLPENIFGDEFGQFKEEILHEVQNDEKGPYGIFVDPKCYCFYKIDSQGKETIIKARFKGVNIKKDKVIADPSIANQIKKTQINCIELHKLYFDENAVKIGIHTFRELVSGQTVSILCSNLEKKIADFIKEETLMLKQRFFLKDISKNNIEGEYYC